MSLVQLAESTAREHLEPALPRRWAHSRSVAAVAGSVSKYLGEEDADVFVSAAWLHDVGYSPDLAVLGFHPVDGALFLLGRGFPERIANLVAFHSGAAAEAHELGLDAQLAVFVDEQTLVRDLLWYADMTVGPDGQRMSFPARMAEVRQRYAPDHYVVRALAVNWPQREVAIERAEAWIRNAGLPTCSTGRQPGSHLGDMERFVTRNADGDVVYWGRRGPACNRRRW